VLLLVIRKSFKCERGIIISIRPLALTRSSHVKNINFVLTDELADQSRGTFTRNSGRIDEQMRALLPNAKLDRLRGPAS